MECNRAEIKRTHQVMWPTDIAGVLKGGLSIMSRILLSSVAAIAVLASAQGAAAQTEIQWWHAMPGALGEAVNAMVDQFNKSQSEYKINAVYKGSYPETLT